MENPIKTKKPPVKRKKLGEILVQAGLIDLKTLSNALDVQKIQKKKIGRILIDMGVVDDVEIANALAGQLKIPFVRLQKKKLPDEVISLLTPEIAEKHLVIPIKKIEKGLIVAMANPLDQYAIDDLRFFTRMSVVAVVAPERDILEATEKYYPKRDIEKDLGYEPGAEESLEIIQRKEPDDTDGRDLLDLAGLPPVVRFANAIIADAIRLKASDIHIEPQKEKVIIRCRVDGIMDENMRTDKHVHAPLVSRIKIISNLDITIRRKPQDGKAQVIYGGKGFDLRVSTIPTSEGEKVTIRILNPATAEMAPKDLGFSDKDLKDLTDAISVPQGIVLVTGPTGSGKSSTLYACLNKLNTPEVNIVTVEDPVEFDVRGINQVQINPKAGITFAAGLRSILRQDPDIVMVGEIRDSETASIAFQAAQTGHLVLSTLHTNDAPSAVTRLLDLGIEDYLISASLIAVLGQRLVRRVCKECKVPNALSPQIMKRIRPYIDGDKEPVFWKGEGCEACQNNGYSGRMALYEILMMTRSLKELLKPNVPALEIKSVAQSEGFQTMTMDGIQKAMQGLTSIDEVFRVAPPDIKTEPGTRVEAASVERHEAEGIPRSPVDKTFVQDMIGQEVTQLEERPPFTSDELMPFATEKPNILVADDNRITLKVLCKTLESENYQVFAAENGLDALELVSREKPDLIVTDYNMPRMDGMMFIKKLKSQLATRYVPIIMLTGKGEVESEVEVINAGADDYLVKPVNPKRFLARVHRLLKRPCMNEM
ncbi:MAG: type II/IV secretion system protein [Thermodesulfobacteriota bacterium]|nr:type II/IV secretion system protein [Thermodesulfobacteriota bacterium]